MFRNLFILLCIFTLLQSCMQLNGAFIPTGYEPSMLQKKGDCRLNISTGPHLIKVNYNRAISDKAGINISPVYFRNGFIGDIGYIRFINKEKINIDYSGGVYCLYNYTEFRSKGNFPPLSTYWTDRKFNMFFYAPYIAGSFVSKDEKNAVGFSLKTAYNFIDHYNFYQEIEPRTGSGNVVYPTDEETLSGNVKPFFSVEPALHFHFKYSSRSSFKMQLGFTYINQTYSTPIVSLNIRPE